MKDDRWKDLEESLERLMPYYEKMNSIMSLGNDKYIREEGLENIDFANDYLDAGSGPGNMAEIVTKKLGVKNVFMMDPSKGLLAINRVKGERILGKFENMPFRNSSFDLITCAFSFRDAISHEKAANEISRVLNENGKFLLVDIGKPDNPIIQFFFFIYILIFPVLSSILVTRGRLIHEYFTLFFTYLDYPSRKRIERMFKNNGLRLIREGRRFGGALFYQLWLKTKV
jgi:demethylmenaquinone methyltransferase/2-methoxy-6-polyprenyl-1,4-benzoquinol methylase